MPNQFTEYLDNLDSYNHVDQLGPIFGQVHVQPFLCFRLKITQEEWENVSNIFTTLMGSDEIPTGSVYFNFATLLLCFFAEFSDEDLIEMGFIKQPPKGIPYANN